MKLILPLLFGFLVSIFLNGCLTDDDTDNNPSANSNSDPNNTSQVTENTDGLIIQEPEGTQISFTRNAYSYTIDKDLLIYSYTDTNCVEDGILETSIETIEHYYLIQNDSLYTWKTNSCVANVYSGEGMSLEGGTWTLENKTLPPDPNHVQEFHCSLSDEHEDVGIEGLRESLKFQSGKVIGSLTGNFCMTSIFGKYFDGDHQDCKNIVMPLPNDDFYTVQFNSYEFESGDMVMSYLYQNKTCVHNRPDFGTTPTSEMCQNAWNDYVADSTSSDFYYWSYNTIGEQEEADLNVCLEENGFPDLGFED